MVTRKGPWEGSSGRYLLGGLGTLGTRDPGSGRCQHFLAGMPSPSETPCTARSDGDDSGPWEVVYDAGVPLLWKPGRSLLKDATQMSWMDPSEGTREGRAGRRVGYNSWGTRHHPTAPGESPGGCGRAGGARGQLLAPSDGNRETVCACAHMGVLNALL